MRQTKNQLYCTDLPFQPMTLSVALGEDEETATTGNKQWPEE